jgi:hypothetical protein
MTRKDYKLLAASFARTKPLATNVDALAQWKADVLNISGTLAMDNSRFSSDRFLSACSFSATEGLRPVTRSDVRHG